MKKGDIFAIVGCSTLLVLAGCSANSTSSTEVPLGEIFDAPAADEQTILPVEVDTEGTNDTESTEGTNDTESTESTIDENKECVDDILKEILSGSDYASETLSGKMNLVVGTLNELVETGKVSDVEPDYDNYTVTFNYVGSDEPGAVIISE